MPISETTFNYVKENFGLFASWAVWSEVVDRPKSNMGDLSIFENPQLTDTLKILNNKFILVGLNISTIDIKIPLSNFHGENGEVYKARFALKDTPLWGGYMTDIIKDFKEPDSTKIVKFLKNNPDFITTHIDNFCNELTSISAEDPILVAFGNDVYSILQKFFSDEYQIIKIPHYAARYGKEKYRENVLSQLSFVCDIC